MKIMKSLIKIFGCIILVGWIWMLLEKSIYGEIQPRVVDTIISIVWAYVTILAYIIGFCDGRDQRGSR